MKKLIFNVALVSALILGAARSQAEDKAAKQEKDQLDARIHEVNDTVKHIDNMKTVVDRVSTETGIPRNEVQSMRSKYPDVGPAGLLVAGVLADETKKPARDFLDKHNGGKNWAALARENNVSLTTLSDRLNRFEQSITSAQSTTGTKLKKKD